MKKSYALSAGPTGAPGNLSFITALQQWQRSMTELYELHENIERLLLIETNVGRPDALRQERLLQLRGRMITTLLAFIQDTDSDTSPLSLTQLNSHCGLVDQKCLFIKSQLDGLN